MIPTSGDQRPWAVHYVDAPTHQAKIGPTAIDHLTHTPDFVLCEIWRWSRYKADGTHLSDHDGMVVTLASDNIPLYSPDLADQPAFLSYKLIGGVP